MRRCWVRNRDDRAGLEVRNHVHANSTGSLTTLFHCHQNESCSPVLELSASSETRLARRQPTCHQPLPRRATAPEPHSPSPGGVCEASSTRSRNRKDRVDAASSRGGHATLVSGHQIRRPKPVGQRNLGPVKNSPGCQRNLVPAFGALMASLVHQFIGSSVPASRTR